MSGTVVPGPFNQYGPIPPLVLKCLKERQDGPVKMAVDSVEAKAAPLPAKGAEA